MRICGIFVVLSAVVYAVVQDIQCSWVGGIIKGCQKKNFKRCSLCVHASTVFKKKWKPALRETLDEEENSRSNQQNRIDACIRMYEDEYGSRE